MWSQTLVTRQDLSEISSHYLVPRITHDSSKAPNCLYTEYSKRHNQPLYHIALYDTKYLSCLVYLSSAVQTAITSFAGLFHEKKFDHRCLLLYGYSSS